ncbi:MAG: ABC transporter permease [Oscillospiraceae bacterium]|nr:ABC transporter permease [Oscillospiraceae bacterium]
MDTNFIAAILNSAIRSTTPIMMAALGSAICNRVGVFNVALEGQMLIGAFSAIAINWFTGSIALSVIGGILIGGMIGLLVGYLQVRFKAADMVVGTSINLFVGALSAILLFILFGVRGSFKNPALLSLPAIQIPILKDLPFISVLLRNFTAMDYFAYLIAIGMYIYLFKTIWGYHTLSVGVKIEAAESMGLHAQRTQIMAVMVSGLLCGFGGVTLSMGQVTLFTENMTAGRGFIGMAACNLGRSNPLLIILASLFFGFCDASASIAQNTIPSQLTQSIPYISTIIALIFFSRERMKKIKNSKAA